MFPNDVRPEHGFEGETSTVSPKVIEQWLNQTLTDAEHLDIPSVILKPQNKVPTSRYLIDRNTLHNAGLSNDDVDRIFRTLFVYSVGYYEQLKKTLSNCTAEMKLTVTTNIWKVYIVLLEYCCKTDYRLVIEQI